MDKNTNTSINTTQTEKSSKTNRKNKTKQVVNWPSSTTFFTLPVLWKSHNPDFKEITLRVRLGKALENKTVAEIGHLHVEKGRPQKVYAMAPVTPQALAEAKQAEVIFNAPSTVGVVSVTAPSASTPTAITHTPEKQKDGTKVTTNA